MIILDTNIISEITRPAADVRVLAWYDAQPPADVFLCGPVVMEQSYGAERFHKKTGSVRYLHALEQLLSRQYPGRIIEFDGEKPRLAGRLRAEAERRGRPVSIVDCMVAATCLHHDAVLATRNTRDFRYFGLKLINPFEG